MKRENSLILLFYILLLFIVNLINMKIETLLIIFTISFVIYLIFLLFKFKTLKKLFLSPEAIFESVFFVYSIMAAVMFIIDGYKPRIYFFQIDYDTIYRTLKLYFNINCIFLIITLFKNGPQSFDCTPFLEKYNRNCIKKLQIWDLFAVVMVIYFAYLHFRNGFNIFGLGNRILRELIDSGLNSYIYMYMIIYSSVRFSEIIYSAHLSKKNILVLFIILPFWLLSLLTDRRNIINFIVIFLMILFSKIKKVNFRLVLKVLAIFLIFLSWGYFRNGSKLTKDRLTELFYMSNGEFILSHYVSEYYINNYTELYYGKTYTFDTLTKLVPRAIYPNKPEDLSEKFYKEANTNVGFAFNPVAEGIINFGIFGATIVVPFVIYFYVWLSKKLYKENVFSYFMVCGYSINIFRGFFSNSAFAILFMFVIIYLMTNKSLCKE